MGKNNKNPNKYGQKSKMDKAVAIACIVFVVLIVARKVVLETVHNCLSSGRRSDWYQIKGRIRDDLAKFIYTTTKRKPMIIPMIMNV